MTELSFADGVARAMTEADWPAVQAGFMHSFLDHRAPAIWAWRYQLHLPGQSGWIAAISQANDGTLAAFVGASVHRCWIHGQELPLLLVRDHYSHPLWRGRVGAARQGPLVMAAKTFHAMADANAVALAVGIGLDRTTRLEHLLGLCSLYQNGSWWQLTLPAAHKPNYGHAVQVLATDFSEPIWNDFWAERRQGLKAALVRDQAFLAWRFADRQGRCYWRFALWSVLSAVPVGFVVLTPTDAGQAVLVDIMLPEQPQAVRDAWNPIVQWLQARGISQVRTFLGKACPAYAWLARWGFVPLEAPLPVQAVYRSYSALPEGIDLNQDYAFTLADSDLY
ncbi:MAG: hypothetical protein PHX60_10935 [Giesbergeria sp.]|uniref:hypothetical protein n=1 Tax=Giesbergeria sp. TaxID=2818473 RepID=UPI002610E2B0|nr:hypothetical protein [Giesbergeria sp.]MDD2610183.1 hypothetical protein [Giesbergeria sp.]